MSERPATEPDLASRDAREARWWTREPDGRVRCTLCPRRCRLAEGQAGFCFVRQHLGGRLVTLAYGRPAALAVDPIEKKPLFHFLPGSQVLSLGTAGCNLGCKFCQNWQLARARAIHEAAGRALGPTELVALARQEDCAGLAFTYNEPTIFGEYVLDTARLGREAGLATVMVTNGYITREALDDIYPWIDAANVDLKAFTDAFYRRLTLAQLTPVLDAIVRMRELGVWLELTTMVIPGLNDAPEELAAECDWIVANLGADVPLHLSAFHPAYQLLDRPPTPLAALVRARRVALDRGLRHVYCGNVRDPESDATRCPACGRTLIRREGFSVIENHLARRDTCSCGARIAGRFGQPSPSRSDAPRGAPSGPGQSSE